MIIQLVFQKSSYDLYTTSLCNTFFLFRCTYFFLGKEKYVLNPIVLDKDILQITELAETNSNLSL